MTDRLYNCQVTYGLVHSQPDGALELQPIVFAEAKPAQVVTVAATSEVRIQHRREEALMQKRLVTRYATKSATAADENQRRVEAVFEELAAAKPDNVSYIVLRLADDSFVHVSFHNHSDDEVNPISSTAAFSHFQQDHADRREGGVDQQTATLVGAYITAVD